MAKANGDNGNLLDRVNQQKEQQKEVAQKPRPETQVASLVKKMEGEIKKALPSHLNVEKFSRIFLTTIRQNPKLLECTQTSLLAALMQSAQLGLEPGLMGLCYLIPYENRKLGATEVQFQIGYRGLIELSRRSGEIQSIMAEVVHEHDEFEYEYGLNEKLRHKPVMDGERGKAICYYAYAKLKDGGHAFSVMSLEDIIKIRDKYSKTKNFGPWVDEFDAMAKKTVIKRLMKFLPISTELLRNVSQDETVKHEVAEDMTEIPNTVEADWEEVEVN